MIPLWTALDAAAATGGSSTTDWLATGVSIDSRNVVRRRFVRGAARPNHDGHDFVAAALARGAAAAMVDREVSRRAACGAAAPRGRLPWPALARSPPRRATAAAARILAVTGSVGKTGTKEALRLALGSFRPDLCFSAGGLNNHWGAPLSLARLPAECRLRRLRARHEPSRRDCGA